MLQYRTSEGRELVFTHEDVSRARSRTDDSDIQDEIIQATGHLYVMPKSQQFDLTRAGGEYIKGKLGRDSLRSITEENGDIGIGALGTWCVVRLMIRTDRKNGIIAQTSYKLLDVVSVKNPPPEASPS